MTVFYGTDRRAVRPSGSGGLAYVPWFYGAVAAGVVTMLLAGLAWKTRRRGITLLSGVGVLATLGLAAVTVTAQIQGRSSPSGPGWGYGDGRGELQLGTCEVSIPGGHRPGEVERPSVLRFEFAEDPSRHVVLLEVVPCEADEFFGLLADRIARSARKEAFVFVHGFNVTFEAAARRTAQLAYDLRFDGAPIFYSWPSRGGLLKYAIDETNVQWTVPHLIQFLRGVARRSGAESVHLIAHSMGNRALTSALESLADDLAAERPAFQEVVLTAPDIDADVFRRDIAPRIVKTARRVTLYASSNDEALALSKKVHGYPRAGDSGPGLIVLPGIDTIDVSAVDTSLIGHSYYGSNQTVLADLIDLLDEAKPPDLRPWLHRIPWGHLAYWVFRPPAPRVGGGGRSYAPIR